MSHKLASLIGGQPANNLDNRQALDCRANLDCIQAWKGHSLVDRRGSTGIGEESERQGTVMESDDTKAGCRLIEFMFRARGLFGNSWRLVTINPEIEPSLA